MIKTNIGILCGTDQYKGKERMDAPSTEFENLLNDLSDGAKVGLDITPGDIDFSTGPDSHIYWRHIKHIAEAKGHRIIPLSDGSLMEDYREEMDEHEMLKEDESAYPVIKKDIFNTYTEAQFIYNIKRSSKMLENIIINDGVDLAVVPNNIAGHWYSDRNLMENTGVEIGDYIEDMDSEIIRPFKHDWKKVYDNIEMMKSIKDKGRITDNKPDFIGLWDGDDPGSLFEMYIESKENHMLKCFSIDMTGNSKIDMIIDPEDQYKELLMDQRYMNGKGSFAHIGERENNFLIGDSEKIEDNTIGSFIMVPYGIYKSPEQLIEAFYQYG